MPDILLDKTLPEAIQQAENLPSMPAVAVEVLRLTQSDDSTIDDLANVLSMDPALSAKLLKLSNSSMFNLGSEVTSLNRATMVLGLKTVKLMSLSFSLVGSMQGKEEGRFNFEEYWHRSLVNAVSGRVLATAMGSALADEAFLCGLLCRIGQLVLARCLADYDEVLTKSEGSWPTTELEEQCLGFTGSDISTALLQAWELPALICNTVAFMHTPEEIPADASAEAKELVRIMHVASKCEELFCGLDKGTALQQLMSCAAEYYKLNASEVTEFLEGLEANIAETGATLAIDTDGMPSMQEIVATAQTQLVRVSLGVATEAKAAENKAMQLESRNAELRDRANKDKLTGLPNRASFDEFLDNCIHQRVGGGGKQALGLLMMDVDKFKTFNDTHGHQVGDEVLKLVGRTLADVVRDTDLAARYGGEEFAVVMPQTTSFGLKSLAERIRSAVEAQVLASGGEKLSVTISIGGACTTVCHGNKDAAALLKIADHYLYKAKENGRNRCEFFPKTELPKT